MRTVRPPLVVELAPALDQHLGFRATAEPLAVEQLFAQLAAEALGEPVLPGATRRDEGRAQALASTSFHPGRQQTRSPFADSISLRHLPGSM